MSKESRFAWANKSALKSEHFNIELAKPLIKEFLFSSSITLIYSPPKQGKTWLGYAIAKKVASMQDISEIHYLDMDNSIMTLKERKIDKSLISLDKVFYHTRASVGIEPIDFLENIANGASIGSFDGCLFFLDTTKDFIDTDNPRAAKNFMRLCVKLRDAGATILILHHATKNKKTISGDQIFLNTPDNVYEMKQISKNSTKLNYMLTVTHARGRVENKEFSVDTTTLDLESFNPKVASLNDRELALAKLAKEALKKAEDGMSRSALISAMGVGRTDRVGLRVVNELEGVWWIKKEYSSKKYLYFLKEER